MNTPLAVEAKISEICTSFSFILHFFDTICKGTRRKNSMYTTKRHQRPMWRSHGRRGNRDTARSVDVPASWNNTVILIWGMALAAGLLPRKKVRYFSVYLTSFFDGFDLVRSLKCCTQQTHSPPLGTLSRPLHNVPCATSSRGIQELHGRNSSYIVGSEHCT